MRSVAIPSQTQLQEDIPEDVRGRVFGILNMLVSVASFAPILIVGPLSDFIGTTTVLVGVGLIVTLAGVLSIVRRGPIRASEPHVDGTVSPQPLDPVAVAVTSGIEHAGWRAGLSADDEEGSDYAEAADGHRTHRVRRGGRRASGTRGRGMTASADLVVVGRIATLAGADGPAWAEAIAVREGRVVAAGRADDVAGLAGPGTRRLELRDDEVAIPGLTDAHLHLADAALERSRVDLDGCASIDELVRRVRAAADAHGASTAGDLDAWIEGGGWDPDALGRWPTADDLDRAAPGRLVTLWAHDHHALVASPAALVAAGIDERRADPAGGVIRRDGTGRPTGVLHERASSLVTERVPRPTARSIADALVPLATELLALGVVAVHDPGSMAPSDGLGGPLEAYRSLAAAGLLPLRVHAMPPRGPARCRRPGRAAQRISVGTRPARPAAAGLAQDVRRRLARLAHGGPAATDGARGRRDAAQRRPRRVARLTRAAARAGRGCRRARDRDADPRHRRRRGPGRARRAGADRR